MSVLISGAAMLAERRSLRATLTLVAAGAATLAGGSALAATHTSAQAAAACVTHASTPVRTGHLSGIIPAAPASTACQAANPNAGQAAIGDPPLIWHGGAVMGTAQTGPLVISNSGGGCLQHP